jgi:hypothetical protein
MHKEKSQNCGQKDPHLPERFGFGDVGVKHNLQIFENLEGPPKNINGSTVKFFFIKYYYFSKFAIKGKRLSFQPNLTYH